MSKFLGLLPRNTSACWPKTPAPRLCAYRRVAERYLSSEGELKVAEKRQDDIAVAVVGCRRGRPNREKRERTKCSLRILDLLFAAVSSDFVAIFDDGNKSRIISSRDEEMGQISRRIMLMLTV